MRLFHSSIKPRITQIICSYKYHRPTPILLQKNNMQIQTVSFKTYLLQPYGGDASQLGDPREYLVSVTVSCLLNEMRYYESDDQRRDVVLGALELVEETDPEFVLQLAVYLRRQLGVRTTTNFILAYAACSPNLRHLLPKYFPKATVLPSDLIELTQFTQIIHLLKQGQQMRQIRQDNALDKFQIRRNIFLPNQLKKVLIPKILAFSEFQLGKYCSEASRKATIDKYMKSRKGMLPRKLLRQRRRDEKERKDREEKEKAKMELQGKEEEKKKEEEEKKKGQKKAKKIKMIKKHKKELLPEDIKKKAIDQTFLTMKDLVELCHIKATKLTSAIVGAKYPKTKEEFEKKFGEGGFDESLAGKRMKLTTPVTWETELSQKGNKPEVWQSLIAGNKVPYLASLRNLRNIVLSGVSLPAIKKVADFLSSPNQVAKANTTPLQYYSALSELDKAKGNKKDKPQQPMQLAEKLYLNKEKQPTVPVVDRSEEIGILEKALEVALQLSLKNVEEIKGTTQIFVDVSGSMKSPLSGGKSFGSVRQCYQLSIILGLMVMSKCQKCQYYIFSSPRDQKCYLFMNEKLTGNLTQDIATVKHWSETLGGGTDFPTEVVQNAIHSKAHIDNMIILSDMMISQNFDMGQGYIDAIDKYRAEVNPKLRVFSVDLRGYSKAEDVRKEFKERNFIRIYGANTSILRFIAEKEGAQVEYIRNYHATLG